MCGALALLLCFACFYACGDDDFSNGNCKCGTDQVEFQVGNGQIYMPNVFSPNGDGINDIFLPWASDSIDRIEQFVIRNGSGEMLFSEEDFEPNLVEKAWFGNSTLPAYEGLFKFEVTARSVDGIVETFSGEACSFPCLEGSETLQNLENCKWGTQHDGAGGFGETFPSLEQLDCF